MSQLHTPDDLARSLREHADRIAPEPLDVADVRRRAAGIRRRRHGAALVAVVAGVALAVGGPVALTARNHDPIQPAAPTPSVVLPRSVPLVIAEAPRGADPAIPYAMSPSTAGSGGSIVPPGGAPRLDVSGDIVDFAPLGSGWVVGAVEDSDGSVRTYAGDGTLVGEIPSNSLSIAASADGSVVAYGDVDGNLHVAWDDDTQSNRTLPVLDGEPPTAAGVVGTAPCADDGRGNRCTAYWNHADGAFVSSDHEPARRIDGLQTVADVAADGRIVGQVSHTDDGSCSAVLDESLRQLWKTCDYSLGGFSPDGRYLVAYPAYRDGAGDTQVSILDSRTGRALVHFSALSNGFVFDTAWESADELIAVVRDEGSWHLLRLGVDGEVERVGDPIRGDDYVAPVVLPARG